MRPELDALPAAGVLWPSLSAPYRCQPFTPESRWGPFLRHVKRMTQPYQGKDKHPGWSPCTLRPPDPPTTPDGKRRSWRLDELVTGMSALVIDCDKSTSLADVARVWGAFAGLAHTTRKHTPAAPRARGIIPFSRVVTVDEYKLIWNWAANINVASGITPDYSTRNPSRFWYLPGANTIDDWRRYHEECLETEARKAKRDGDAYVPTEHVLVEVAYPVEFLDLDGEVLDVDVVLARVKAQPELAADKAPPAVTERPERPRPPAAAGPKRDDAFSKVNAEVPIKDVAAWLGVYVNGALTCPGCGNVGTERKTDVAFVGNGLKCSHNTCADKGNPRTPGFRSVVDLVAEVKGISAGQALSEVGAQFSVTLPPPPPPAGFPTYTDAELAFSMALENHAGWSVARVLEHDFQGVLLGGRLRLNEMDNSVWLGDAELQPEDVTALRDRIEEFVLVPKSKGKGLERMRVSREVLDAEIYRAACRARFHPVRDYLRSLTWDGTKRIEHMCTDVLHVEPTVLHQAMIKRFLISAVARAMEPGCKVDTVFVIIGVDQGEHKSSFFRDLTGPRWFSDSTVDIHNKDAYLNLGKLWIQEWAELETMLRARDASTAKSFITSATDLYRAPYEPKPRAHPRSCVIVGTTNKEECLSDEKNRRWWPIQLNAGLIDLQLLREWRDQLWAEATALYDAHEQWWLTDEEKALLVPHNKIHQESHAWEEPLLGWAYARGAPFTTAEIMVGALSMDVKDIKRADEMRVASILRVAGFVKSRKFKSSPTWALPEGAEVPAAYRPQVTTVAPARSVDPWNNVPTN